MNHPPVKQQKLHTYNFKSYVSTNLLLLFVKIVDNYSYEQVKGKERSKDDEKYEVKIHVNICFSNWLFVKLQHK